MGSFEKLGAFYLGRRFDSEQGATRDELLLYDARDLTTHAVCVGMTGSGKTGLCISLLEEAAIDGVPALAIDPKGDLGNLLLTFPELRPEDFRPWIDEGEAEREGRTPDEHAAAVAGLISLIQSPPFDRVGVLALDAFFPAKERSRVSVLSAEFEAAAARLQEAAAPGGVVVEEHRFPPVKKDVAVEGLAIVWQATPMEGEDSP